MREGAPGWTCLLHQRTWAGVTHKMGENICKMRTRQGINTQNTQRGPATQWPNHPPHLKAGKSGTGVLPEKTHEEPVSTRTFSTIHPRRTRRGSRGQATGLTPNRPAVTKTMETSKCRPRRGGTAAGAAGGTQGEVPKGQTWNACSIDTAHNSQKLAQARCPSADQRTPHTILQPQPRRKL